MAAPRLIRQLRLAAEACFANGGTPRSAEELAQVQALLSKVTLAHIGLSAERLPDRSVWYMSIWRTPRLDLSVFLLGRHATLPLHDHPHMTVLRHVCLLSHLLHGAIEYTVYDWATSAPPSPGGRGRVARLHARGTVQAPTKPMVVSPTADNVHEFTALAPAALFDVIAPPYDDACGRSCRYYRPRPAPGAEDLFELVEEDDVDYTCTTLEYFGEPAA